MEGDLEKILSYELPLEKIAQRPAAYSGRRDSSRLLHAKIHNESLKISDLRFPAVTSLLNPGDVLVVNNTKVIHARFFIALDSGRVGEVLLVRPLEDALTWECLGKPLKKLDSLSSFQLSPRLQAHVVSRINEGRGLKIRLEPLEGENLEDIIREDGSAPIPPYIREGVSDEADKDLYQTVYSDHEGSVAAPTAGLHFTEEIILELREKGVEIHNITLHVGPYSFFPVAEKVEQSQVLEERFFFTRDVFKALTKAKDEGRRVIAVGTTVVRCIETVFGAPEPDTYLDTWSHTKLMITPGYEFKIVSAMFTNFHQPRSTHLLLVSAFLGIQNMAGVYSHALEHGYRFLSYGDSSFLEP